MGFMSSPECPLDRRVALTRPAPAFFETVRDVAGTPCGARASSASHEPRAARDGKRRSRGRALI
ncbi:hypothetical protein [Burkholderia pseudomallei]|uniref:hypothetical protein n=1 Tax=Burkholderia pseudomallei TaxID=28450 RepID=UPI0001736796|nr:hypothetical protein [Burkholderia pseudomallei]EDU09149.1 hypothetical protein BURPS1655_K0467 [Burkholderia pseudomallei 1655]EXJ02697.1 hypothetical protein T210_0107665 [Burkholderia pseudomallei MSHR6137]MBF3431586.1 hypothetical protein [Burkholderia pseudomallei]MBF3722250.1 hypothetical protein [Burkholderia pseudomallei]MBF3732239.1 hypothetical protein [Burkholderia pseudomallei]